MHLIEHMNSSAFLKRIIEEKVLLEQSRLFAREAKELEKKAAILVFTKLLSIYVANLYVENQIKEAKLKNTLQSFSLEISSLLTEMRNILSKDSHKKVCKVLSYLMVDGRIR